MRTRILPLAAAALLAAAAPAHAQSAADCQSVEVKWTVPEYAVNGHFTLNVPGQEIVNPWSDERTAMIRGKVKNLEIDGNQIAFTTSELHEVTITVDENCNVIALTGTGESRNEGSYDITLGKE